MKIDTTGWKQFKVDDLFEKLELKFTPNRKFNKAFDISTTQNSEFTLPLVNAKNDNNGIMYYGRECDFESAAMTIDIVADGASSTGNVYAQPQKTGVLYNAYLVKPKHEVSEHVLFFLAAVIQRCVKQHFGYDNKCTWDRVREEMILLPVTETGVPDWDYMDSYMSGINKTVEQNLQALSKAKNSGDSIDTSSWKGYRAADLFEIKKGRRLTSADRTVEGNTPYIGALNHDNGVFQYIVQDPIFHGNSISVNYNSSAIGQAYYQEEDYWATDDVNVWYFREENQHEFTRNIALFICTIIIQLGKAYAYTDKWKLEDMQNAILTLPATTDGKPDWDYMDSYMEKVLSNSYDKLSLLNESASI